MKCLKCGDSEHSLESHGFCDKCFRAIEEEAAQIAEDEYGTRWLRERLNDDGTFVESARTHYNHDKAEILRALAYANKKGLDWRHPKPSRLTLDIRREVMTKYGAVLPARGRPKKDVA